MVHTFTDWMTFQSSNQNNLSTDGIVCGRKIRNKSEITKMNGSLGHGTNNFCWFGSNSRSKYEFWSWPI